MGAKFLKVGESIDYVNAGAAIAKGAVVVMGHTIGIALEAIAATTGTGPVAIEGVFSGVPKVSAAVFVVGEKLVFDISAASGAGEFDDSAASPATGDITGAAIAVVAGANLETTCTIKPTPGNATKT